MMAGEIGSVMRKRYEWELRMEELQARREALEKMIREREAALAAEQSDVDALKTRGMKRMICRLFGKLDTRLQIEQEEALKAQEKRDEFVRQLTAVQREEEVCAAQIGRLKDQEEAYAAELMRTAAEICRQRPEREPEIRKAKEHIKQLQQAQTLMAETAELGRRVRVELRDVKAKLQDAANATPGAIWQAQRAEGVMWLTMKQFEKKLDEAKDAYSPLRNIRGVHAAVGLNLALIERRKYEMIESAIKSVNMMNADVARVMKELRESMPALQDEMSHVWEQMGKQLSEM